MITLISLPYPPSLNRYYRYVTRLRRVLISNDGRQYRKIVSQALTAAKADGLEPFTGRLRVALSISPPDRRRRDLDNVLKALLDSLTYAGVWVDDSQIDVLEIRRLGPERLGRVRLAISEIEGAADGQKLPARKAVRGKNATRGSGDTQAHEGASPGA